MSDYGSDDEELSHPHRRYRLAGMKRAGPVELTQHADWSTWRDVRVPLDEPATDAWLVHVEGQLRRGLTGFQSMEFEPGRPLLGLVINEPRDDADAVTAEIDSCLTAAP